LSPYDADKLGALHSYGRILRARETLKIRNAVWRFFHADKEYMGSMFPARTNVCIKREKGHDSEMRDMPGF
jgi:hypothetical protein